MILDILFLILLFTLCVVWIIQSWSKMSRMEEELEDPLQSRSFDLEDKPKEKSAKMYIDRSKVESS